MNPLSRIFFLLAVATPSLTAGTVLLSSLPDSARPLAPLTALNGVALAAGAEVRVGAFPGLSDDGILNTARTDGLAGLQDAFTLFGSVHAIGDGTDGQAGSFEIAVRQSLPAGSPLIGQEISVLIRTGSSQEFLVARFKGRTFSQDPDTALEPLISLHLADAKVIAGNRPGINHLSTAPKTTTGSFPDWIARFAGIETPEERLAAADPDHDGRSNFLEYATGGTPDSGSGEAVCQLVQNEDGRFEVQFPLTSGIGIIPSVEWSPDLVTPWTPLEGAPELLPERTAAAGMQWFRLALPETASPKGFFRLRTSSP